jgi:hypothetical protein
MIFQIWYFGTGLRLKGALELAVIIQRRILGEAGEVANEVVKFPKREGLKFFQTIAVYVYRQTLLIHNAAVVSVSLNQCHFRTGWKFTSGFFATLKVVSFRSFQFVSEMRGRGDKILLRHDRALVQDDSVWSDKAFHGSPHHNA